MLYKNLTFLLLTLQYCKFKSDNYFYNIVYQSIYMPRILRIDKIYNWTNKAYKYIYKLEVYQYLYNSPNRRYQYQEKVTIYYIILDIIKKRNTK